MFMGAMASYRRAGLNTLMIEDKELTKKYIDAQIGKALPMLWPEQQDKLRQQGERAKNLFENATTEEKENLLRWGSAPGED
jgi:hypothetical protein